MAGQTVTIGTNRLNDLFYVSEIDVGVPEFVPNLIDRIDGGAYVNGMRVGTADITMRLVVLPNVDVRRAVSTLLSWLDVGTPQWMAISRDGGKRRRVVATGAPTIEDTEYEDVVVVELLQVDPYLYGDSRSVTVTSTYATTITVGGDAPTCPSIVSTNATRRASDDLWGVIVDGSTSALVKLPQPQQTAVSIDCDAHTATVGNDTAALTLDSDWPELAPGNHTLVIGAGGGTATVTWVERWHR